MEDEELPPWAESGNSLHDQYLNALISKADVERCAKTSNAQKKQVVLLSFTDLVPFPVEVHCPLHVSLRDWFETEEVFEVIVVVAQA